LKTAFIIFIDIIDKKYSIDKMNDSEVVEEFIKLCYSKCIEGIKEMFDNNTININIIKKRLFIIGCMYNVFEIIKYIIEYCEKHNSHIDFDELYIFQLMCNKLSIDEIKYFVEYGEKMNIKLDITRLYMFHKVYEPQNDNNICKYLRYLICHNYRNIIRPNTINDMFVDIVQDQLVIKNMRGLNNKFIHNNNIYNDFINIDLLTSNNYYYTICFI